MTHPLRSFLALAIFIVACALVPLSMYADEPCTQGAHQDAAFLDGSEQHSCGIAQLALDGMGSLDHETGSGHEAELYPAATLVRELPVRSAPVLPYVCAPPNTTVLLL